MIVAGFKTHPAADVFPLITGKELYDLVQDIKTNGLIQPVVFVMVDSEKLVLDGRNRLRACLEAGVEPRWEEYTGDSPAQFVISTNVNRRHLDPSQRAAAAVLMLPVFEAEARERQRCGQGGVLLEETFPQASDRERDTQARDQAGDLLGVSGRTVQKAKKVHAESPALFAEVQAGRLDLTNAVKAAGLNQATQDDVIKRVQGGAKASVALRHAQRDAALDVIRSAPTPLPDGPYRVIVADPPWHYDSHATNSGHRGSLTYPTMQTADICAMPVGALAEDNAFLWLWTTNSHMRDAYDVADAWGFQVKTILTWVKPRIGLGDWLRARTEHCLLCVRGRPVINLTGGDQTTVLEADRREHSRKPDEFYALVEDLCAGSKLELFAREPREGWFSWGAESTKFEGAA